MKATMGFLVLCISPISGPAQTVWTRTVSATGPLHGKWRKPKTVKQQKTEVGRSLF